MAKVKYVNSDHPTLLKWIFAGIFVIAAVLIALYSFDSIAVWIIWPILVCAPTIISNLLYNRAVIDEEEGIVYGPDNKEHPIKIDEISYMTYKKTQKGRTRSLFIHDKGRRFMEIGMKQSRIETVAGHLLRLNPEIEVREGRFF